MAYSILVRPATACDLRARAADLRKRIDTVIGRLRDDSRPAGCQRLVGFDDEWRVRVGDYRVLYVINDSERPVVIARIAHRREAYR